MDLPRNGSRCNIYDDCVMCLTALRDLIVTLNGITILPDGRDNGGMTNALEINGRTLKTVISTALITTYGQAQSATKVLDQLLQMHDGTALVANLGAEADSESDSDDDHGVDLSGHTKRLPASAKTTTPCSDPKRGSWST
ncbi:hypothetical protein ST47_g1012 [Ascochyta rabiei]|uniref:Uncharacterized protein n=1 Tax=Didymella rabiei TaxID=5454 RepID=A0A163LJN4_DIDRA|nr:hypothetical protein ST47_g1012 [Ascochyta rabiei]